MKTHTQVSISPSNKMYYIWNEKKFIFIKIGEATKKSFDLTKKYYREKINTTVEQLELSFLELTIRNAPQAVKDFFVVKMLEYGKNSDLSLALVEFDYTDNTHKQILIDVLYCVNENNAEGKIEYNENINSELSSINVFNLEATWKSEFTKKKTHKKIGKLQASLGVSQIKSFVADSEGITFKLKSGSFYIVGYGDMSEEYDALLKLYSWDGWS